MLLYDIQREQQVQQSARSADVLDQLPVEEVKWTYKKELTAELTDQMHGLATVYADHFAFGMHDSSL